MMQTRNIIWSLALLVGIAALYGGWIAWLAYRDLVTLDVRRMDVREVVKKVERQTWEDIFVDRSVQGTITLNVRRMPLPEVLRRIAGQTSSRPSTLYPLYSSRKSLETLKQALRGEVDPMTHGWTNLQSRAFAPGPGGFPGMGMMGPGAPVPTPLQNNRVSLNILDKDVSFAALALLRYAQARVVPEDGTSASINLILEKATVPQAVAKLARAAHRRWSRVYALQAMPFPGGPGGAGGPGGTRPFVFRGEGGAPDGRFAEMNSGREESRQQREAIEEELKQVLPAAERQKLEQAQQAREQQMQELANMTPEQRRERMMNGAEIARMQRERVLNSTPEQRAEMNRHRGQMRPPGPPPR